jgi:hypothetical protein
MDFYLENFFIFYIICEPNEMCSYKGIVIILRERIFE